MSIEKSSDPDAFTNFERVGWDDNISDYDEAFGPVTRHTAEPTLDAAKVRAGMRVLDVCTGPGMLAECAIGRGAEAVGVDFSEEAVALARNNVPNANFYQGNAQELPFPNDDFDAVVCGYGVMHVSEPELAIREMQRVVRPGGRIAVSSWDNSTPNNALSMIYAAVAAHGSFDVQLPHGPDFFQFGTKEKMQAALSEIGLSAVDAVLFEQYWHVKNSAQIVSDIRRGTVRARALLAAQNEDAVNGIHKFLEEAISNMGSEERGFDVLLPAIIGSGTKST